METKLLLKRLGKLFPLRLAKEMHDPSGHQVGMIPADTRTILLCLDFDEFVYDEMIKKGYKPDLILTHHPFIYQKKKIVFANDEQKKDLYNRLEQQGFCLYSYHLNFDLPALGMNDALVEKLELGNPTTIDGVPFARGGELPHPMSAPEAARYIKEKLGVKHVKMVCGNSQPIHRVAIIGGGGAHAYRDVQKAGYDAFISGDAPHYLRRDVLRYHFNYFDVTHEIERVFMPQMAKVLKILDQTLEILVIDHEIEPDIL